MMHRIEIKLKENPVQLLFKDTPGMDKYKKTVENLVKYASKIILVFSITNKESYHMVSQWI